MSSPLIRIWCVVGEAANNRSMKNLSNSTRDCERSETEHGNPLK
jgi:hypothetical protein